MSQTELFPEVARRPGHPAPFSGPILAVIAGHLRALGVTGLVLDPFAGTGRVHRLRDVLHVETVGVELEPEWAAMHPATMVGNALDLVAMFGPARFDAVVTSPAYGSRMADHHDARDGSVRFTYRHQLGRELHPDNGGAMQWGDGYRMFHRRVWREAVTVLRPGGVFLVNVKDHIRGGVVQPVTAWHVDELGRLGLVQVRGDVVPTRGLMAGANSERRTGVEYVVSFRKPRRSGPWRSR